MSQKILFIVVLFILAWLFVVSPVVKEVAAGVAILLFGMKILEKGFNVFVEGTLQHLLTKATDTLFKSFGLGFIVTALIQSSSLISVITISFLSAGLIQLSAGIGIIFGANLGTTVTAWLVSLFGLEIKVSSFALPMIAFGVLFTFQKAKSFKGFGNILTGLGFFFLGIHYMKDGFNTYEDSINLAEFMIPGFLGLISFIVIGIIITLVFQSSSAAIALVLTALAAGQISYSHSLSLVIGINIGTTITAALGSISANYEGKRLAAAHFIFQLVAGVVVLSLFIPLGKFVDLLSKLMGIAADDFTLKIALFHTLFNLIGVLIMLPLLQPLRALLQYLFKDTKQESEPIEYPVYLNETVLEFPQTALRALLDESKRLFEHATFQIVSHGLSLHRSDILGKEKLKVIVQQSKKTMNVDVETLYSEKVKVIYSKIIKYATLAQSKFSLTEEGMEAFTRIKLVNRNIVEVIKNIRGLNANVSKYMISENTDIQAEYDRLRRKVSVVLREVDITRKEETREIHLLRLQKLKKKAQQTDVMINGRLDKLIREQKISSVMATSLVNDSQAVSNVMLKLIETAELLYIDSDTILKQFDEEQETKG
jgi:phosphate:Na+ symporter